MPSSVALLYSLVQRGTNLWLRHTINITIKKKKKKRPKNSVLILDSIRINHAPTFRSSTILDPQTELYLHQRNSHPTYSKAATGSGSKSQPLVPAIFPLSVMILRCMPNNSLPFAKSYQRQCPE